MSRTVQVPQLTPADLARESGVGAVFGQKARTRVVQKAKTGTRGTPYPRADGTETVKVSFTGTTEFDRRLRVFVAGLEAGESRSEWLVKAITAAMDAEEVAQRKRAADEAAQAARERAG